MNSDGDDDFPGDEPQVHPFYELVQPLVKVLREQLGPGELDAAARVCKAWAAQLAHDVVHCEMCLPLSHEELLCQLEQMCKRFKKVHSWRVWFPAGQDWANMEELKLLWLLGRYRVEKLQLDGRLHWHKDRCQLPSLDRDAMRSLGSLRSLQTIQLSHCSIASPDSLVFLAFLPQLRSLAFGIDPPQAWLTEGVAPLLPQLMRLQQVSEIEVHVEKALQIPAHLPEQVLQLFVACPRLLQVRVLLGTGWGVISEAEAVVFDRVQRPQGQADWMACKDATCGNTVGTALAATARVVQLRPPPQQQQQQQQQMLNRAGNSSAAISDSQQQQQQQQQRNWLAMMDPVAAAAAAAAGLDLSLYDLASLGLAGGASHPAEDSDEEGFWLAPSAPVPSGSAWSTLAPPLPPPAAAAAPARLTDPVAQVLEQRLGLRAANFASAAAAAAAAARERRERRLRGDEHWAHRRWLDRNFADAAGTADDNYDDYYEALALARADAACGRGGSPRFLRGLAAAHSSHMRQQVRGLAAAHSSHMRQQVQRLHDDTTDDEASMLEHACAAGSSVPRTGAASHTWQAQCALIEGRRLAQQMSERRGDAGGAAQQQGAAASAMDDVPAAVPAPLLPPVLQPPSGTAAPAAAAAAAGSGSTSSDRASGYGTAAGSGSSAGGVDAAAAGSGGRSSGSVVHGGGSGAGGSGAGGSGAGGSGAGGSGAGGRLLSGTASPSGLLLTLRMKRALAADRLFRSNTNSPVDDSRNHQRQQSRSTSVGTASILPEAISEPGSAVDSGAGRVSSKQPDDVSTSDEADHAGQDRASRVVARRDSDSSPRDLGKRWGRKDREQQQQQQQHGRVRREWGCRLLSCLSSPQHLQQSEQQQQRQHVELIDAMLPSVPLQSAWQQQHAVEAAALPAVTSSAAVQSHLLSGLWDDSNAEMQLLPKHEHEHDHLSPAATAAAATVVPPPAVNACIKLQQQVGTSSAAPAATAATSADEVTAAAATPGSAELNAPAGGAPANVSTARQQQQPGGRRARCSSWLRPRAKEHIHQRRGQAAVTRAAASTTGPLNLLDRELGTGGWCSAAAANAAAAAAAASVSPLQLLDRELGSEGYGAAAAVAGEGADVAAPAEAVATAGAAGVIAASAADAAAAAAAGDSAGVQIATLQPAATAAADVPTAQAQPSSTSTAAPAASPAAAAAITPAAPPFTASAYPEYMLGEEGDDLQELQLLMEYERVLQPWDQRGKQGKDAESADRHAMTHDDALLGRPRDRKVVGIGFHRNAGNGGGVSAMEVDSPLAAAAPAASSVPGNLAAATSAAAGANPSAAATSSAAAASSAAMVAPAPPPQEAAAAGHTAQGLYLELSAASSQITETAAAAREALVQLLVPVAAFPAAAAAAAAEVAGQPADPAATAAAAAVPLRAVQLNRILLEPDGVLVTRLKLIRLSGLSALSQRLRQLLAYSPAVALQELELGFGQQNGAALAVQGAGRFMQLLLRQCMLLRSLKLEGVSSCEAAADAPHLWSVVGQLRGLTRLSFDAAPGSSLVVPAPAEGTAAAERAELEDPEPNPPAAALAHKLHFDALLMQVLVHRLQSLQTLEYAGGIPTTSSSGRNQGGDSSSSAAAGASTGILSQLCCLTNLRRLMLKHDVTACLTTDKHAVQLDVAWLPRGLTALHLKGLSLGCNGGKLIPDAAAASHAVLLLRQRRANTPEFWVAAAAAADEKGKAPMKLLLSSGSSSSSGGGTMYAGQYMQYSSEPASPPVVLPCLQELSLIGCSAVRVAVIGCLAHSTGLHSLRLSVCGESPVLPLPAIAWIWPRLTSLALIDKRYSSNSSTGVDAAGDTSGNAAAAASGTLPDLLDPRLNPQLIAAWLWGCSTPSGSSTGSSSSIVGQLLADVQSWQNTPTWADPAGLCKLASGLPNLCKMELVLPNVTYMSRSNTRFGAGDLLGLAAAPRLRELKVQLPTQCSYAATAAAIRSLTRLSRLRLLEVQCTVDKPLQNFGCGVRAGAPRAAAAAAAQPLPAAIAAAAAVPAAEPGQPSAGDDLVAAMIAAARIGGAPAAAAAAGRGNATLPAAAAAPVPPPPARHARSLNQTGALPANTASRDASHGCEQVFGASMSWAAAEEFHTGGMSPAMQRGQHPPAAAAAAAQPQQRLQRWHARVAALAELDAGGMQAAAAAAANMPVVAAAGGGVGGIAGVLHNHHVTVYPADDFYSDYSESDSEAAAKAEVMRHMAAVGSDAQAAAAGPGGQAGGAAAGPDGQAAMAGQPAVTQQQQHKRKRGRRHRPSELQAELRQKMPSTSVFLHITRP